MSILILGIVLCVIAIMLCSCIIINHIASNFFNEKEYDETKKIEGNDKKTNKVDLIIFTIALILFIAGITLIIIKIKG